MSLQTWAQGIYLLASIFGVGVTAIDMLGILGSDDSDGDVDDLDGLPEPADFDLDHGGDAAEIDVDVGGSPPTGDGAEAGDVAGGELVVQEANGADEEIAVTSAGDHSSIFSSALILMTFLRRAVYFSLGFGPVGLAAIASGATVVGSLLWAVPSGVASSLVAGWIFRLQRRDLDSSITNRDLFFQRARVTVPIMDGGMGRVRVALGQALVERYARAENSAESFSKGTDVYITRVTKECVFVESISPKNVQT